MCSPHPDLGTMSPYPTVLMVTTAHQDDCRMELKSLLLSKLYSEGKKKVTRTT